MRVSLVSDAVSILDVEHGLERRRGGVEHQRGVARHVGVLLERAAGATLVGLEARPEHAAGAVVGRFVVVLRPALQAQGRAGVRGPS